MMAETSRPPVLPPRKLFPTPDCVGVGFQPASGAIGLRVLHPGTKHCHASEASEYQNELQDTVCVRCRHWHIVLSRLRAPYEARDAIVKPGHLGIDDIQNGHVDERTGCQVIEAPLDQLGSSALQKA